MKVKKPLIGNELEDVLSDIRKYETTAKASLCEIIKIGEDILNGSMKRDVLKIQENIAGTILNDRKRHNLNVLLWHINNIFSFVCNITISLADIFEVLIFA